MIGRAQGGRTARAAIALALGRRTARAAIALALGRRTARAAIALALVSGACAGTAGPPALASGEGAAPSGPAGSSCPSPNPPNELTLAAGTPQTTTLYTAFATGLQVALTNSDGCAVTGAAGVPVTFSAPSAGASGRFSASSSNTVTVGADASGSVAAPAFTANGTPGAYTVIAASQYGSVAFSLANTAAGTPARLSAIRLQRNAATVTARFPQPLQARVLDAAGNPVAGATVTFTLGAAAGGACGSGAAAGAAFAGGATQATATSDASGLATSPVLTANAAAGRFSAEASVATGGGAASAEGGGKGAAPGVAPVSFSLVDLPGRPAKLAPGVGATQSTPAGAAFPVRLAVTVTDAEKNPVAGALVTFSAPAHGASGRFTIRSRASRRRRGHVSYRRGVQVRTGACGIAVAPPFSAGPEPGGYIVKASAAPAHPVAFALVDEAPGRAP